MVYNHQIFVADNIEEIIPDFLFLLQGCLDCSDLPLNVSREILQQNRVMTSIRNASVKKLLGEFKKIADQNPELYTKFIEQYNRPLKEGLYQDYANRDDLIEGRPLSGLRQP